MAPGFRGKLEAMEKEMIGKNTLITSLLVTNRLLQESLKAIYTGVHMSVIGLDALVGVTSPEDPTIDGLLSPNEINMANHSLLADMSLQGICLLFKKIKDANETLRETEISLARLGPLAALQPETGWDTVPSPITRSLDLATRTLEALQKDSLDEEERRYSSSLDDASKMIDVALEDVSKQHLVQEAQHSTSLEPGDDTHTQIEPDKRAQTPPGLKMAQKARGAHLSPKLAKLSVPKSIKVRR
jgi:hypothetical protein